MAYPPIDPEDATEPLDSRPAKYGAEELRALKGRVDDLASSLAFGNTCGGRITLDATKPVMTANVTAADEIFLVPYNNAAIARYNGANFVGDIFATLTNDFADNTKNPAAVAPNSVYDLFYWLDGATKRLSRGPAWSSGTARGAGAGTTQIHAIDGIYLNQVDITNGPAADRGTYVGSFETDGASQANWILGGGGAGGVQANLTVWNRFNRRLFMPLVKDTASWSDNSATIQPLNSSILNRVRFLRGLHEDEIFAKLSALVSSAHAVSVAQSVKIGFGVDSIAAFDNDCSPASAIWPSEVDDSSSLIGVTISSFFAGNPGLGVHYLQALELTEDGDGGARVVSFTGTAGSVAIMAQIWA